MILLHGKKFLCEWLFLILYRKGLPEEQNDDRMLSSNNPVQNLMG